MEINYNISLSDRMKNYEKEARLYLPKNTPLIIRVDGKNFSKFTKGFKKPFDVLFHECMYQTARYLCENIQGAEIAYSQSDEITILIQDNPVDSSSWYGKQVQKICSVSASLATVAFNKSLFELTFGKDKIDFIDSFDMQTTNIDYLDFNNKYFHACFDARAFIVPDEEVNNVFIWRQQDAIRNSISMVGRSFYSQKELKNVSSKDLVQKLLIEHDVDFYLDYPTYLQRGFCVIKKEVLTNNSFNDNIIKRNKWFLDSEIPLFTEDRTYCFKI